MVSINSMGRTQISQLVTNAGTTVTKFLEKEPMRGCSSRLLKEIKYAPNSKLAQMGIDRVVIRNAGKEGKHIMAFNGGKCVLLGKTKPESAIVRSVTAQFKEYIDAAKTLLSRGFSLK